MHDFMFGGFPDASMSGSLFDLWSPSKNISGSSSVVRERRHTICGSPVFSQTEEEAGSLANPGTSSDDCLVNKSAKRFRWSDENGNYPEATDDEFPTAGQLEDFMPSQGFVRPSSAFRRHSTTEISENLYPCPWAGCTKSFNRFYNLRSHYRTHTQEKPYECRHCDLAFARNHDLKRHMLVHSDAKPFNCPNCSRPFGRHDAMKRHYNSQVCVRKSKNVQISEELNEVAED